MRKIFPLRAEGKHNDRVLDAVKHEIRKYLRRERRRDLPEGADFWDFDCRFGRSREDAAVVPLPALTGLVGEVAAEGGTQVYVEILAKPGRRGAKPANVGGERDDATSADPGGDGHEAH